MLAGEAENTFELAIYAHAGETIFVWQEVKMGLLYARNKLQLVSAAEGKAGVRECGLIDFLPPALPRPPSAIQPSAPVVLKAPLVPVVPAEQPSS